MTSPYQPTDVIERLDQIRDLHPPMHPTQPAKVIDHIDPMIAAWIEHSPFLTLATVSAKGHIDVSPKGDPPGFVRILDRKSLAIPDRPGNHRFDGFANLLETGRIGLVFFVPNRTEVVRVNGSAQIVRDLPLRQSLAIKNRIPELAILVRVEEAFYHCGKAIIRSGLWSPEKAAPIDDLPSYSEALNAHCNIDMPLDEIQERMTFNETHRLYDE